MCNPHVISIGIVKPDDTRDVATRSIGNLVIISILPQIGMALTGGVWRSKTAMYLCPSFANCRAVVRPKTPAPTITICPAGFMVEDSIVDLL